MRASNEEKYNSILNQEKGILKELRASILANKINVFENFSSIVMSLNNIDLARKQSDLLLKMQVVICDLLTKIANADSIEELTELRSNLNKQIIKVRNTLKKIDGFDTAKNEELIKTVRENITKFARTKKREMNHEEIENLLKNSKYLSKEEHKHLSNKIRNEKSYVDRYQKINNTKEANKISEVIEESIPLEIDDNNVEIIESKKADNDEFYQINGKTMETYIKEKCKEYNVLSSEKYGTNFFRNVASFFNNIAIYHNNRVALKHVSAEYASFTNFEGLRMIMDYLYHSTNIKSIINKTFFNREYVYSNKLLSENIEQSVNYINSILEDDKKVYVR